MVVSGAVLHRGTPEQIMRPDGPGEVYDMDIRVDEIDGSRIGVHFA